MLHGVHAALACDNYSNGLQFFTMKTAIPRASFSFDEYNNQFNQQTQHDTPSFRDERHDPLPTGSPATTGTRRLFRLCSTGTPRPVETAYYLDSHTASSAHLRQQTTLTMSLSNRRILILYGSETGTAQDKAEEIDRMCQRLRFHTDLDAMDNVKLVCRMSRVWR